VRVDVAFIVVLLVIVTSDLDDDAAVDIEPRGSFVRVAWKRETDVFKGGAEADVPAPGASGKARSTLTGVGGGEMKATFFWTSLAAFVVRVPFCALRELRLVDSGSKRGEAALVVRSGTIGSIGGGVGEEYGGVGVDVGASGADGSPMAGKGRVESGEENCEGASSGRGLNDGYEVGVDAAREGSSGGHEGRGGNFSF
jgi:hypothetical protein